jgi:transposase
MMDEKDKIIEGLREEIRLLKEEIARLYRLLGMNSGNSSKPPSSDGFRKKPAPRSLREVGRKPSGGQKGHKGTTLEQVGTPHHIVEHMPQNCHFCGKTLAHLESESVENRQVFDSPQPIIEVTQHQAVTKKCACGKRTKAAFPMGVLAPTQYGPRLKSSVIYLMNQHFLPEDRLQILMQDLFGVSIATATLASMSADFAEKITPFQERVLAEIKASPVKHVDETGCRIAGKTQWLHVISTTTATHYRMSAKRKDLAPIAGTTGVLVHDHWKPYFQVTSATHALCNAHHLRELKALIEIEKEPWAQKMDILLRYMSKNSSKVVTKMVDRIMKIYDLIVKNGLKFHESQPPPGKSDRKRRIGHNLLLRFQKFKAEILRFFTAPSVPFTNNQAEQDIRMMKVRQKISGGFRTSKGAENFATIRGFLSTMRKQNVNILDAIASQYS